MGSYYADDHIAEDHVHKGITTCNIEEPPQKTVTNRLLSSGFSTNNSLNAAAAELWHPHVRFIFEPTPPPPPPLGHFGPGSHHLNKLGKSTGPCLKPNIKALGLVWA